VTGDLVPAPRDLADEVGVPARDLADDEERGRGAVAVEPVEVTQRHRLDAGPVALAVRNQQASVLEIDAEQIRARPGHEPVS
jgi:hypothetical protein